MNPIFTASKEGSAAYFNALNEYMEDNVLHPDKGFICKHAKACEESCRSESRELYSGQLHHIGKYYDLKRNGKPFRIVISGSEYGVASKSVSIKDRTDDINGLPECEPRHWNPHMRGTLVLLQLLLGKEPENPSAGEGAMSVDINGNSVNIFWAFSMANFLLCSALDPNSNKSIEINAFVENMRHNCGEHYKKTLEKLKPQIVILQGTRSRWCGFWENYDKQDMSWNPSQLKIERVKIAGCSKETLVLPLYHPSYRKKFWGGANSKATREYVKPAVDNLLKEYEKIYG